ncbi:DeoR/GlpR family DNA-binding transcription regulator [Thermohalobacter berrensis]|uniref:DeoR family transcriptional regulator n=1 Tax=Thermohalobacter berrensis TaxID=99594 RepID=A0A419T3W6_9FIRM|nr:DeoR/GlpR family DNA-binding transcription regulator [Thermohalobacter berrensis]RKD32078.1 DeoR family transcriptional regulator [Thermohalobacter berrensis]
MFAEERKIKILDRLDKQGKVRVKELSKLYNVSEATIRRDLQELEERGMIKRTHGGAVLTEHTKFEPTFLEKEDKFHEEKEAIGKLAASLIEDGDTIAIDSGTTTLEIAKNIKAKNLTIVTNSLDIAYEIGKRSDIEVVITGGMMRWKTRAMVGPIADNTIKNLRVDKVFLGTNGICIKKGITTPNLIEAQTKRALLKIASQAIVVCDHTKFNQVSFAKIADINEVDIIITDNKLPSKLLDKYKEQDIEIMISN